jgi:hypothetical protein
LVTAPKDATKPTLKEIFTLTKTLGELNIPYANWLLQYKYNNKFACPIMVWTLIFRNNSLSKPKQTLLKSKTYNEADEKTKEELLEKCRDKPYTKL